MDAGGERNGIEGEGHEEGHEGGHGEGHGEEGRGDEPVAS